MTTPADRKAPVRYGHQGYWQNRRRHWGSPTRLALVTVLAVMLAFSLVAADVSPLKLSSQEPIVPPPGLGVRQSSGPLEGGPAFESGRGLPQSKTLSRVKQRVTTAINAHATVESTQPSMIRRTSDATSAEVAADVSPLYSPASAAVVTPPGGTPEPPLWIVVLREDAPLDDFLADHGIAPRMVYRGINGFAAPLAEATRAVLQAHPFVESVEADGPVTLCADPPNILNTQQHLTAGLVRLGVDQFPLARINVLSAPFEPLLTGHPSGASSGNHDFTALT